MPRSVEYVLQKTVTTRRSRLIIYVQQTLKEMGCIQINNFTSPDAKSLDSITPHGKQQHNLLSSRGNLKSGKTITRVRKPGLYYFFSHYLIFRNLNFFSYKMDTVISLPKGFGINQSNDIYYRTW